MLDDHDIIDILLQFIMAMELWIEDVWSSYN